MDRTVKKIRHLVSPECDIDLSAGVDAKDFDAHLNMCITQAKDALDIYPLAGYNDFERDNLKITLDCLKYSHQTIRRILSEAPSPSTVDALAIARLQVETLYTFCLMLQDAKYVRDFLKYGWKQKYIRFLLLREEYCKISRFSDHFEKGFQQLQLLQARCLVSEDERHTIEEQQLGKPLPKGTRPVPIERFPTPGAVVDKLTDPDLKKMLVRLYVEYEFLCVFAHGGADAEVFKASLDPRSPVQEFISPEQRRDLFQCQLAGPSLTYSLISAVQCATEVAARCPNHVELQVKLSNAWSVLRKCSLWSVPVWEIRAKKVLPKLLE